MDAPVKEPSPQSSLSHFAPTGSYLADSLPVSRSFVQAATGRHQSSVQMDFITNSHLYHQIATEHYRTFVQTLRQEITELQQKIDGSSAGSEYSSTQKEIDRLTETLTLQKKLLRNMEQTRLPLSRK